MIPKTLNEWTLESIRALLEQKVFESDSFDFKEKLPHSGDTKAKGRLRKSCCAFANSDGGFLIFGISDSRDVPAKDRFVGIESSFDFPESFGNYPKMCDPSIQWEFRNPALVLENGKHIHVVYIPKSWKSPHATGSQDSGWHFIKRTNKGNEGMGVHEIRHLFLGFYEKRLKLGLLKSELIEICETAKTCFYDAEDKISDYYSLSTFELNVIESIISDTYSITVSQPKLLQALSKVRKQTRNANTRIRLLHNFVGLPMTNTKEKVKNHNQEMKEIAETLQTLCEDACNELDVILGAEIA